jgi:hypothetical protein
LPRELTNLAQNCRFLRVPLVDFPLGEGGLRYSLIYRNFKITL